MFTIACVLKTGGDYDAEYVLNLAAGVRRHLSQSLHFVCMTDLSLYEAQPLRNAGINIYPLMQDLPGWWSKLEVFKLRGDVLYFDLDTLILGDISPLADAVQQVRSNLIMLRGFRRGNWASGIMGWSGDWRWVLTDYLTWTSERRFDKRLKMTVKDKEYKGDQDWLDRLVRYTNISTIAAQDMQPGIMSYKNHVQREGVIPDDCRVLCFHGRPRPHHAPEWIAELWRCGRDVAHGAVPS